MLYAQKRQTAAGGFDLGNYYASRDCEVWPENWEAAKLFARLGTQWRVSFSGVTGLDYAVLFRVMDQMGLTGDDWMQVFADIQVMEAQAMEILRASN